MAGQLLMPRLDWPQDLAKVAFASLPWAPVPASCRDPLFYNAMSCNHPTAICCSAMQLSESCHFVAQLPRTAEEFLVLRLKWPQDLAQEAFASLPWTHVFAL